MNNRPRLFVDVDDTLIAWEEAGERGLIERYHPNERVIALVRFLVESTRARGEELEVVVWSTGGEAYARFHAEKWLPGVYTTTMSKYPRIPVSGELYIDDDPLPSFKAHSIHPNQIESGLSQPSKVKRKVKKSYIEEDIFWEP